MTLVLQRFIYKLGAMVHMDSARRFSTSNQICHIILDILGSLQFGLQKFDHGVSGSIVDEEEVIFIPMY